MPTSTKTIKRIAKTGINRLNAKFGLGVRPIFVRGTIDNFYSSSGDQLDFTDAQLRGAGAMVVHRNPHKIYFFVDVLRNYSPEFIKETVKHEYNHSFVLLKNYKLNLEDMEIYANSWMSVNI